MPGFFSSTIANPLTRLSGHLIDWSRFGELAGSMHRYSTKELIQRGAIVAATGLAGYASYRMLDEDDSGLNRGLFTMAGCFVGFVASHTLVIAPLIYKRNQLKTNCCKAAENIAIQLQYIKVQWHDEEQSNALIGAVERVVHAVMNIDLANEHHANASQTLGKRLNLLNKINERLYTNSLSLQVGDSNAERQETLKFWSQNLSEILDQLQNSTPCYDIANEKDIRMPLNNRTL